MKTPTYKRFKLLCFFILSISFFHFGNAQEDTSNFWDHVRFGGGIGLNAGNGTFSATVAPSAIYQFNQYFSFGPSLIYSYQKFRNAKTSLYGGSLIALANPIQEIQLSAEIEQLRVNQNFNLPDSIDIEDNFWNTALFVGGGYRMQGVTIGVRYNLLFREDDGVYAEAWAPFVRVYF